MKIIECEQGTAEWHAARAGRVTASRIADITRKIKSGGVSKTRQTYLGELVAERLSGVQSESGFKTAAMDWGNEQEPKARDTYAFVNGVEVVKVGLVIHPKIEMAAASPDSLVGDDGLLEIKCPNTATHIATLTGAKIDSEYAKQVQWQMACTGRQWTDLISFDPRLPAEMQMHTTRIRRDPMIIAELEAAVVEFLREVDETIRTLRRRFPVPEAA